MRRWILLGLLAMITPPAGAAKRVTVAQLEQTLTAAAAAHKSDAEIVRLISGIALSERLSEATLDRLDARLNAGPQVALDLRLLADQSAFLDLPAGELPATAAPDQAAQLRMFDAAARYVAETLARLPNFLATRTTNRYNDSPQELKQGAWPVRAGLHQVDQSSREVSIRGEQRIDSPGRGSAVWDGQSGMTSWGEFGAVLGMILNDSVNGKVRWSHWEETSAGQVAVFHYSVPKSASHFEILSVERTAGLIGFEEAMSVFRGSGTGTRAGDNPARISQILRGYQGSLWLDPVTGAIRRITIEADSNGGTAFLQAAMLVQYGEVEIGGSQFVCPVRSVALSRTVISAEASTGNAPSEWLNETLFTGYHRFAATARILAGEPSPQ
jgi:hypothetical protein